jgi:hypothetical protein
LQTHEYIEQLIAKQQTTLNSGLRSDKKAMTVHDFPRFVWKHLYTNIGLAMMLDWRF